METLFNDLRAAIKTHWKYKGITLIAVVSLAIGIGANTAIFSIVNSALLRPRAVSNPEQLVELYVGRRDEPYQSTSYPSYLEFRERNEVFTGLAAYHIDQFKLGGAHEVEQIWGEAVSGNYFEVLGLQPQKGRMFLPEEDVVPGRNPVVVISHGLWQRRFNSDPSVIGQPITINNQVLTVIGIAPPQYTGIMRGLASEVWVPTMMMPQLQPTIGTPILTSRGNSWVVMIGRLKPDVTVEQARARFDVLGREMQAAYPEEWRSKHEGTGAVRELFVTLLSESETRLHPSMQSSAYALVGLLVVIVNLVLLIACINLAGMLLARAVARRKEIAVRLALGASRARIIRQLLTESVLLSLIAGAAGVALAIWLLGLLMSFMPAFPEGIRVALNLQVDWKVVVYAVVFSTLTGLVFGLAPALHSSRADVSSVLKDDASGFSGRYRKSRLRMSLVVAQVAFSVLLLISAGLVLRSLEKIRPTRLGFTTENVLVVPITLDEAQYDRPKTQELYRQLSERVASLPGVQTVSLVDGVPGGFMGGSRRGIEIEGYRFSAGESMEIDSSVVGPRYFSNMKVPLLLGRDFEDRDREGAPCVAIINEAFSQRYFSDGSALGKHLARRRGRPNAPKLQCEIVGIVRDNAWQSLQKVVRPFFALSVLQSEEYRMTLLVNSDGNPASLTQAVRRTVHELDPKIPVNDVKTLTDHFSTEVYPFRLLGLVMGSCGFFALLLATVGIYGVVSYSVAQRTREVGIRMALGAIQTDILKLVVGQGMVPVAFGLGAGLLLSFALTRVLTSSAFEIELLFGITATDSLTFIGVTLLLSLVGLVACYMPARRAMQVDPVVALREE